MKTINDQGMRIVVNRQLVKAEADARTIRIHMGQQAQPFNVRYGDAWALMNDRDRATDNVFIGLLLQRANPVRYVPDETERELLEIERNLD